MNRIRLNKINRDNHAMYLAYDQGLEHGPLSDFNDKNIDPLYILKIAKYGKFQGIVFHKGIAEKYSKEIKKSRVPLILKLNGKTKLYQGEPIAEPICSVKEAIQLGAKAVGFTIYIGSKYEAHMSRHFAEIEREAHEKGLPVILWVYPRGKTIKDDTSKEMMSYAARFGLEIGADIVKLKWNSNFNDLKWTVKSAGRCKVVVAGGIKKKEGEFLKQVKEIKEAGAFGIAVGRNVWQFEKPLELSKKIGKILFEK